MKILNICSVIIISFLLYSCAPQNEFKATKFNAKYPNFSFLDEALKGKRIVALGESSHGFGDLQTYKCKMIEYLHRELGYEVIMMETGYGDAKMTWEKVNFSENGIQIRDNSLFKNFRTEEITPLFDYILEKSEKEDSLIYTGYDTQIASKAFTFMLEQLIKKVDIKIIQDSISSGLTSIDYMVQMKDSLEAWQYHQNKLFAGVDLGVSVLDDNLEEIIEKKYASQKEVDILRHTLLTLKESANYKFGEAYTVGMQKRDSLMALNVIKQAESEFQDKKILIWGHNGHIDNSGGEGNQIKWMGHFLKEKYKNEYYALGMYCKKGSVYSHWQRQNKPFDINIEGFMERKIFDLYNGDVFMNLPNYDQNEEWYNNAINSYEHEAGQLRFIPTQRFDGLVFIVESKVPTFKAKSSR